MKFTNLNLLEGFLRKYENELKFFCLMENRTPV
jgi:hypothetical protein